MKTVTLLAAVVLGLTRVGVLAQPEPGADQPNVEQLVRELGDDHWSVREAATEKLKQIGQPAAPALRKAMLSRDPEVSFRAQWAYSQIVGLAPEGSLTLRDFVQLEFRRGNYDQMIALGRGITSNPGADQVDWLWLGHACQLAGKWKEAVQAYQNVVRLIEEELKKEDLTPAPRPPPPAPRPGGKVRRRAVQGKARPLMMDSEVELGLHRRRAALARWIGRIQAVELKDPKAAVAALTKSLDSITKATALRLPPLLERTAKAELERFRLQLLRDLAVTQQQTGRLRAALAAWDRLHQACLTVKGGPTPGYVDMARVAEAIAALPPDQPLPAIRPVFILTPEKPTAKLLPDKQATRRRSYWPSAPKHYPGWRYAFAPAPGVEFATLEFACDIEQLKSRHLGQFTCFLVVGDGGERGWTRRDLGKIGWPHDKPLGRDVRRARFDIPPGAKLVHIETGSSRGAFNVHSVQVEAAFRPVTKGAKPTQPGARIQTEALPPRGTLTCGHRKLANRTAYTDFKPGAYVLRYQVPGRKERLEADFVVESGRRYGVFVNLDSPFRWAQAGPSKLNRHPPASTNIARLPDGSYLAIWCGAGSKIMLSRTKDLLTWTEPQPAAFNTIFDATAPATVTAKDGTVWLAYFSNRLSLQNIRAASYRLWLTNTRDGRKWTPLKPAPVSQASGDKAACLARGPKGKCRLYWGNRAAAAERPGDINELEPFSIQGLPQPQLWSPHVTVDEKCLLHMVFIDVGRGLYYTTSRNGLSWAAPALAMEWNPMLRPTRGLPGNPQLIFADGKVLLLYELTAGAYITPVRSGGRPVKLGQGVKITNHLNPLHGARATVTPGGEVLLLAGQDTSWLLRAKLKDLARIAN